MPLDRVGSPLTMLEIDAPGKIFWSSVDEVARLVRAARQARAARARGRSAGRTRAARSRRSSPRGACPGRRRTSRRSREYALVLACAADGRGASALRPDRDLVADRGRDRPRRRRLARSPRRSTSSAGQELAQAVQELLAAGGAPPADGDGRARAGSRSRPRDGSVFVVRDERADDRRHDRPEPTVGPRLLRPEELPARRRRPRRSRSRSARPKKERRAMPRRKVADRLRAHRRLARRRGRSSAAGRAGAATGSTSTSRTARWSRSRDGSPEASTVLPLARRILETAALASGRRRAARGASASMPTSRATSCSAPGKRSTYYLDKYRFETVPDLLEALGARLAAKVAEVEPDAQRLAGPELGAVALAAAASLASRLPFLIVRGRGEGVRHREPARGRLRGRRARRPRRGRRHIGRSGRRCRPSRTASCARMPDGHLRHRPGGGRCGRPRAPRRAPASAVSCGRSCPGPVALPQSRMVERKSARVVGSAPCSITSRGGGPR